MRGELEAMKDGVRPIDRDAIDSVRVGITIVWHLHQLFGEAFEFDRVNRLLVNDRTLNALRKAKSPESVEKLWRNELDQFKRIRQKYLL